MAAHKGYRTRIARTTLYWFVEAAIEDDLPREWVDPLREALGAQPVLDSLYVPSWALSEVCFRIKDSRYFDPFVAEVGSEYAVSAWKDSRPMEAEFSRVRTEATVARWVRAYERHGFTRAV